MCNFAVHPKLTQHCTSAILQLKKKKTGKIQIKTSLVNSIVKKKKRMLTDSKIKLRSVWPWNMWHRTGPPCGHISHLRVRMWTQSQIPFPSHLCEVALARRTTYPVRTRTPLSGKEGLLISMRDDRCGPGLLLRHQPSTLLLKEPQQRAHSCRREVNWSAPASLQWPPCPLHLFARRKYW